MVVVAEAEPALRGQLLQLVHPVGDAVRVVGGLPAVARDERVDHGADAQAGGSVEGALRVVGVDDGRVTGRGGDTGGGEGLLELLGALDERVRLDLGEADLGDPGDGTLQVLRDGVANGIELDGGR